MVSPSPVHTKQLQRSLLASKFDRLSKYVIKNSGYFRGDANFFYMKYLSRFLLIRALVNRFGPKSVHGIPEAAEPKSTLVSMDHDLGTAIQEISQDGYYVGLRLHPTQVEQILEFAYSNPCYGDRKAENLLHLTTAEAVSAQNQYRVASFMYDQEACPAVQQIQRDPTILALARGYLQRDPVYVRSDLLWSFPADMDEAARLAAAQVYHCDLNDYRSVKFFFYLTDVGPGDGSHSYIKGTLHRRTLMDQFLGQRIASKDDQALLRTYGEENVRVLTGPAGFGFAGDPYTIHKGDNVTCNCRLLFQVEYSYHKYGAYYSFNGFRKKPVKG